MNASSQSFPHSPADAETTAELPVLDIAAYEARHAQDPLSSTDTWATPTMSPAMLAQPNVADAAAEASGSTSASAVLTSKLEVELRSLASSLSELETRLAAKGERLAIIEAELAESRAAGLAAAEHATALSAELTGSRAGLAAATTQIEALQGTIKERDEAVLAAQTRAAEDGGKAASDAARAASLVATHDSARKASLQQIVQLQAQSAVQLEALHSMEGRRGIFDSILRSLDLQIAGRDQEQARLAADLARNTTHGLQLTRDLDARILRVTQLEGELAALDSNLGRRTDEAGAMARANSELNQSLQALREASTQRAARVAELETQLAAANAAHATLAAKHSTGEAELAALREQSAEHVRAVQQVTAEHAQRMAQIESYEIQITALTAQVATQARAIESEAERGSRDEERIANAETDLRISEDAVKRLEAEIRARNMRVEELTRINTQMQVEIAEARRWLDERDSLMSRLESEAAHSAALVDNIQRSIRTGNTGNHEVVREAGVRLLVRSQDGHEVVHVLGRKTTIGRTPDNDLQIDASFISRHHAVLLVHGSQTIVEDLNSTNGVFVNAHRVSRETLNDGDLVMIGKARFRFAIRPPGGRSSPEPSV
ncbi:MAG TPA: FHA domain-containing protein [Steroidobacteraceae bacterium]|jgi:DNA repair exonuclease SbcCD ATPase subunit|nr:FHA domain-containing protein [Steroidobacteraceae bacterium]